jgi:regulator of protease activity HflC (stomatin/prohibitin superfamily)
MEDISVFGIAIIVLIIFTIILVSRAVRTIPQGENWTVERFG